MFPDRLEVKHGYYERKSKQDFLKRKEELKKEFGIENVELISNIENIAEIL